MPWELEFLKSSIWVIFLGRGAFCSMGFEKVFFDNPNVHNHVLVTENKFVLSINEAYINALCIVQYCCSFIIVI